MGSWRDLTVYKKAFANAMAIYELAKRFPEFERYLLAGQGIRSSRAVCSNIAEAYRKRKYGKHFISKLTDSDAENTETMVWMDFAKACNYITETEYLERTNASEEVGRLLGDMINHPEKYLGFMNRNSSQK
jgi:four helix bundle protein